MNHRSSNPSTVTQQPNKEWAEIWIAAKLPAETFCAGLPSEGPPDFDGKELRVGEETQVGSGKRALPAAIIDDEQVAAGAGIAPNAQITRQPMLIDLAPTILQLLGQPVPDDMDGRELHEMLAGSRAVEFGAAPSVQTAALDGHSAQEARLIEERLAGLGYLG